MSKQHLFSVVVVFVGSIGLMRPVDAAILAAFDPAQTTVFSNGTTQTIPIDLLIIHDGSTDPSTFSGITIDMVPVGPELVLTNPLESDFSYPGGPRLLLSQNTGLYSFGAGNGTENYDVTTGGTASLMTIDFILYASVVTGTFPLPITLRDATRGIRSSKSIDLSGELTAVPGTFVVLAIPEPSTIPFILALLLTGSTRIRCRRTNCIT